MIGPQRATPKTPKQLEAEIRQRMAEMEGVSEKEEWIECGNYLVKTTESGTIYLNKSSIVNCNF